MTEENKQIVSHRMLRGKDALMVAEAMPVFILGVTFDGKNLFFSGFRDTTKEEAMVMLEDFLVGVASVPDGSIVIKQQGVVVIYNPQSCQKK